MPGRQPQAGHGAVLDDDDVEAAARGEPIEDRLDARVGEPDRAPGLAAAQPGGGEAQAAAPALAGGARQAAVGEVGVEAGALQLSGRLRFPGLVAEGADEGDLVAGRQASQLGEEEDRDRPGAALPRRHRSHDQDLHPREFDPAAITLR